MGELGALFNPGMRHEIEERESKGNRREEEGNARDGDLRIDLASGVAVINIPTKSAGETNGSAAADLQAAKPTTAVEPTESTRSSSSQPKPASTSRGASSSSPRTGRGVARSTAAANDTRAKKTKTGSGTDKPARAS